uniref:60S ribosomal protein L34 n=1 Tax=Palpitomonas bilix TaxID=652834 RepID=A0A7S3G861_9EUKA|mmetsp:Transcript_27268/g.70222  ORF Transcript_27268/g.70222 Transcript_27268/m.70222 type:complete len:112 (+) Transcript_27268:67-402(+)
MQRVVYPRRHSYRTKSNKIKVVKTPGGRLAAHFHVKKTARAKCGDTGAYLNGIPTVRPIQLSRMSKNKKTVSRAYGGSLSHGALKNRIVRAFLIEEQKVVKKVLQEQQKKN